jgi:hypothetical protein
MALALALAYDAARVTRDVDAVFKPDGIVLDEARQVADHPGLPPWQRRGALAGQLRDHPSRAGS